MCEEDGLTVEAVKKWRVPQELIDFILAWDVSDYVFATPDDMVDMPISDEYKAKYRAERKQAVAVMQQSRRERRKTSVNPKREWVMGALEKNAAVSRLKPQPRCLKSIGLRTNIDGQIA